MATHRQRPKNFMGRTCREEPIAAPILLQKDFDNIIFHDILQFALKSRSPTQSRQASKSTQNRSISNNIDFLTKTLMWTPSVIDVCALGTIEFDFQRIRECYRIDI